MHFIERTLRWQRGLLVALLLVSAWGFWRATFDVFNTFKATAIIVGTLAIVVVGAVRVSRTRRMLVPADRAWLAAAAFALALAVATLSAGEQMMTAVVGRVGRHTGLAMYLTYLVLFLAVARLYRRHPPTHLARALVVAAVPVTVYGLLQAVGVEPFGWDTVEAGPQVFATLGNANFFSGWLGIVTPLAVYGALSRAWSPAWRIGSGLLVGLALVAQFASASLQGPLAAALGSALVLAVWLFSTDGWVARRRVPLLLGALAAAGIAAGVFLAGLGPLAGLREQAARSLLTRTGHWGTALGMAGERPIFGFGLGSFGDWAYRFRPEWFAVERGLTRSSDSAHNVVLEMLANGGIVLLAGYLAFVGLALWAIVVGLRRLAGSDRLALGGFAGAWLAYQVQSLLSIDVPPLAVLHFTLAGVVVAVGLAPAWREVTLPGAPALPTTRPGGKRKKKAKAVPLAPASPPLLAGIGVVALVGLWVATVPLRADMAAQDARTADDARSADAAYQRASSLAFWEADYAAARARALSQRGQREEAREAYRTAAAREPGGLSHALNIARLSKQLDDPEQADTWYARALTIDPKTPETLAEVGQWRLEQGEIADAEQLLERAVALRDGNAEWWVALGEARSAEGDDDGARAAFQRALELDPDVEGAEEGLEQLVHRSALPPGRLDTPGGGPRIG